MNVVRPKTSTAIRIISTKPEMYYLGVWVALEDANEQNGALNVMRSGHKIPEPDRRAIVLGRFKSLSDV